MILKGFKTLEQLEQKLKAVPEEKRKVIVLVGRHPNEGTIAIANRHHGDWEKHGAVTVQLPREWTPHWLWTHAVKRRLPVRKFKGLASRIPGDYQVISFLSRKKFKVPFVRFHGTGYNVAGGMSSFMDYRTSIKPRSKIWRHEVFSPYYSN